MLRSFDPLREKGTTTCPGWDSRGPSVLSWNWRFNVNQSHVVLVPADELSTRMLVGTWCWHLYLLMDVGNDLHLMSPSESDDGCWWLCDVFMMAWVCCWLLDWIQISSSLPRCLFLVHMVLLNYGCSELGVMCFVGFVSCSKAATSPFQKNPALSSPSFSLNSS